MIYVEELQDIRRSPSDVAQLAKEFNVWNWALSICSDAYKERKESLNAIALSHYADDRKDFTILS